MMRWFKNLVTLLGPDEGGGGGAPPPDPGKGSEYPKFVDQVSPEIREKYKDDLAGIKDKNLNDVIPDYFETKKRSARSVVVPNAEKPDPEETKAFFKALNIPEKPDDYAISTEKFKDQEGVAAFAKEFSQKVHGLSLSKKQAQGLFEYVVGIGNTAKEAQAAKAKEYSEAFEARIFEAVGKDEAKKSEALNLYKKFMTSEIADGEIVKMLADRGLFHNEKFALKMAGIMKKLSDDSFVEGRARGGKAGGEKKGTMGNYSPDFAAAFGGK